MYWIELHTTAYNNVIMPCDNAMFSLCIIILKKKRRRKMMLAKKIQRRITFRINLFIPIAPFLYPLKTSENPWFSDVFKG